MESKSSDYNGVRNTYLLGYDLYSQDDPEKLITAGKKKLFYRLHKATYAKSCESLCSLVGPHKIFREPELHFYVVRNTLRCLDAGVEVHFNKENKILGQKRTLQKFASHYGWTSKRCPDSILSFLTALKSYLSFRKYSPYHLAVMHLRWEYRLSSSMPVLDQPCKFFRQMGGVTYYYANGNYKVLTDCLLDSLLAPQKHTYPFTASKCRTKFYKRLQDILPPIGFIPVDPSTCLCRGYELTYLSSVNAFQAKQVLPGGSFAVKPCHPSGTTKELLAAITGKNPTMLLRLLELFARIASATLPSAKLWIITGESKSRQIFITLLQQLFPIVKKCDFPAVLSKGNILSLYDLALSNAVALYSDNADLPEQYLQRKQKAMKNLVLGLPIADVSDPLYTIKVCSYLAVLFFADNESCLPKSFSGIPTTKIELQPFHLFQLSYSDMQWLQTTAVYIGLRHLFVKNEPTIRPPIKEIQSFCSNFCKVEKAAYCDRTILINAFREYYRYLYGTEISPEYSSAKTLKELIGKTLGIPVQRVRQNQNRLAFKGILFDEEAFHNSISSCRSDLSSAEFGDYLDQLSDQIVFSE